MVIAVGSGIHKVLVGQRIMRLVKGLKEAHEQKFRLLYPGRKGVCVMPTFSIVQALGTRFCSTITGR